MAERFELPEPIHLPRQPRLPTFTVDTLDGQPVPVRAWHVKGLIPARTVTMLSGDGGLGKSILALQLCCATATASRWLGLDVRAGRALYIGAEDDMDELHIRLDQIAISQGKALGAFADLKCCALADRDALAVTGAPGQPLDETELWRDLVELVVEWSPRLIVLDALADFYGASENDRGQVRHFIRMLRNLAQTVDAAIVLLAHPSLTGLSSGTGSSGSTAWNNSVRSRLYLTAENGDDSNARVLTVKKANYAPANGSLRLRYCAGVFASDDAPASGPVTPQVANDRIDRLFLELLDAYTADGRVLSDSFGRNYAPTRFGADPRAKGTKRAGFAAAMERLFATRQIRVLTEGPPSRLRSRIVRGRANAEPAERLRTPCDPPSIPDSNLARSTLDPVRSPFDPPAFRSPHTPVGVAPPDGGPRHDGFNPSTEL